MGTVLAAGLLAGGCLPHGCQREPDRSLFASDSLSRQVAEETPVDTLEALWRTTGTDEHPLRQPRTVRFLKGDGPAHLAVSDVERNSLFRFGEDGRVVAETADEAFDIPYLAGTHGDTLVVFNAGADRIDRVAGGRRLAAQSLPVERPSPETLVYVEAAGGDTFVKVIGASVDGYIARLDRRGGTEARAPLTGPYWRDAGFLRVWGDSLLSLSGFRPVVDVLPRGFADGAQPDSMALVGFNSPMLERSHAYAAGDVSQAPLLAASGAVAGPWLFVLNIRPGWIRIDAYDRSGRLQRRLVQPGRSGNRGFYPLDVAARRTARGVLLAVTIRSPEPRLELYRWRPAAAVAGGAADGDRKRKTPPEAAASGGDGR
jgi:hypothetical protein